MSVFLDVPFRRITGLAYGTAGRWPYFPLQSCRLKEGRLRAVRKFGPPNENVVTFTTSARGDIVIYVTENGACRCLSVADQRIRPIPRREYRAISPNNRFVTVFYQTQSHDKGFAVCRTDTWQLCWQQIGAVLPVWDAASGNRLVFARFVHQGRYYSLRGQPFPAAFYNASRAARERDTHLFVVDFGGPGGAAPKRVSKAEASRLVGGWYPAFLNVCLRHDSLVQPAPNQILQTPRGQGVLIQLEWLAREPSRDPDTGFEFNSPPELPGDVGRLYVYIDANGRVYRHKDPVVEAVCWSRDGEHVYGHRAAQELEPDEVVPKLFRMNVRTGKLNAAVLPQHFAYLLTFREE